MDAMTARWRKSTYSGGNGGDCVQVGSGPGTILVRDTKQASAGPMLAFSPQSWKRFTRRVQGGRVAAG